MEKKKDSKKKPVTKKKTVTEKKTTKAKKTTSKKTTAKKPKKKKAFTLIELLAVIIILGVVMIIAIPSVTKTISDSRKKSYVLTAKNIVDGARTKVNEGNLPLFDPSATYYLPYDLIKTETGGTRTPYGEMKEAYVVVTYEKKGYDYYWTSVDVAGQGINLIDNTILDPSRIKSNIKDIPTDVAICGKEKIIIFNNEGNVEETKEAVECIEPGTSYEPDTDVNNECKYKLVTTRGSFSLTEDKKEICVKGSPNDRYVYKYKEMDIVDQNDTSIPYVPTTVMSYLYLYEGASYFNENTYVKVYEDNTKQNLIKTITKSDFNYKYLFSLSTLEYTNHYEYDALIVPLGVYNFKNIYVEFSEDFPYNKPVNCTYEYSNNTDYHRCEGNHSWAIFHDTRDEKIVVLNKNLEGPWVSDPNDFEALSILQETLYREASSMGQDFRIIPSKQGNTISYNVEFYTPRYE